MTGNCPADTEPGNNYLVFDRYTSHSVIHIVKAASVTEAIKRFALYSAENYVQLDGEGRLVEGGTVYSHPLAYVEAEWKTQGEWQIRLMPDIPNLAIVSEVFCGESSDGPAEITTLCRPALRRRFPNSRARAFVWYLKSGTLVTFYHRSKREAYRVVARYLWQWDGRAEAIEEWTGDYDQLCDSLDIQPPMG